MNSNDTDWATHEVPTHVDSKDRVFLGMTFFQIVVFILVSALAYVIYQSAFAQALPTLLRYGVTIAFWAIGSACVLIEIGGRGVVAVLWDIASHMMAKSRYAGTASAFLDSPPANAEAVEGKQYRAPHEKLLDLIGRRTLNE